MGDALTAFVSAACERERCAGAEMFMGLPDRWYESPRWGCRNGHTSFLYLKSERLGYNACLACHEPVALIPPEIENDDDLRAALEDSSHEP